MKKALLAAAAMVFLTWLYGYKLLDVPTGLTVDEASFGYNAVLLSRTGRDQNNHFLPFFVLTSDGKDWRQPVTQYYLAGLFKLFGPSIFLLRFSSVIVAVFSVFALYYLARLLLPVGASLVAAMVLATAPLLFIQSHLGLDNIMPIPFVLLWLFGLVKNQKDKSIRWLIISALALAISFYSYKGMRPIVPVWLLLSLIWIFINSSQKRRLRETGTFLAVILPFFAIIPLLERLYAGAIFGGSKPAFDNLYDFFLPYLSSFDPSFIFVIGDTVANHSTGRHGMLLLATLPFVIVGIYAMLKEKTSFPKLILAALFLGPLLFGLVGSVHRFSRLMALLPLFAIAAGFGWQYLSSIKSVLAKPLLLTLLILVLVNFADFVGYYWKTYPGVTFGIVGEMDYFRDVARLAEEAKKRNLTPMLHKQVDDAGGESLKFFQQIYFGRFLPVLPDDLPAPEGAILLTTRSEIPGNKALGEATLYHVQIPN